MVLESPKKDNLVKKIKSLIFIEEPGAKDFRPEETSTEYPTKEKSESIDIKETVRSAQTLLKQAWFYYILLIPVIILSLYIRTRNLALLKGKYLLGLDPYYYFIFQL